MEGFFSFIGDDWKKIPQNLRYVAWLGVFLIFNSWLLDHWGIDKPYLFWKWDIRQIGYSLGTTLVLITFGMLSTKQISTFAKVMEYRRKYPIDKLDETFHLVWFSGKLILFDRETRRYHHVLPFETAQDLLFVGLGKYNDLNFDNADFTHIEVSRNMAINASDWDDGGPINTRS